jgi:hypothetical protein
MGKRKREDVMSPGIAFTVGNLARTQQATSCLIEAIQPLLIAESQYLRNNCSKLLRLNPDILIVEKNVARYFVLVLIDCARQLFLQVISTQGSLKIFF